ncbi:MAG: metalloregulator ArsR/SmtB family transcription factor [Caldilineaceae bacterium]|nr:metalloregulator ArsR/SmtB family transcription factor [Caldilineaceae bacterium]
MAVEMASVRRSRDVSVSELSEKPSGKFSAEGDATDAATVSLAAAFKAVGHPVRLRILELLSLQSSPMCVCHIESKFSLSQPTISHHLRLLRKAELVLSERRGTWVYYSVNRRGVTALKSFLKSITLPPGELNHANTI